MSIVNKVEPIQTFQNNISLQMLKWAEFSSQNDVFFCLLTLTLS